MSSIRWYPLARGRSEFPATPPKLWQNWPGLVVNGGIRYPIETMRQLTLARGTPPGKRLSRSLLSLLNAHFLRKVAGLVYDEMLGVVKNGTRRRALRAFVLRNGEAVPVAGKTGTGDNRFKVFAPGGEMVAERSST